MRRWRFGRCAASGDRLSEVAARIERDYPGEGRDVFAAHAAAFAKTTPQAILGSAILWLDDWVESQAFVEDEARGAYQVNHENDAS